MFPNKQETFSDGGQKMYYSLDLKKHSQISWSFSCLAQILFLPPFCKLCVNNLAYP